jgi:cytoskeletal protein CcmA (bactofilin family)
MKSPKNNWRKAAKAFGVFALMIVLVFSFSSVAFAGIEIEGDPDVTIEADRIIKDDVFVSGRDILVEGTIEGDLFASGETVTITGVVEGNVFAAAAAVYISGTIDGTTAVAAYTAYIQEGAVLTRNIYFGGFNLELEENSLVERSIYAGSYQVQIGGKVDRNVIAGSAAFVVDGHIAGDAYLEVGDPDSRIPTIHIDESYDQYEVDTLRPGLYVEEGSIGGDLDYRYSYMETDLDINFSFDETVSDTFAFFFAQRFRRLGGEFVAILLLGALALYFAKDHIFNAVEEIKTNAVADTFWGLLVFLLYIPVVIVLIFVLIALVILGSMLTLGAFTGELLAIGGLVFAGLQTAFGLLVSYGTKIVFSYLIGRWILDKGSQLSFESFWNHFAALALGAFLFEVIRIVPVLGWLVMAIFTVIGIGAFFVLVRNRLTRKQTEITPA